jgi:tetratricopeptide (TPR) repeat protein
MAYTLYDKMLGRLLELSGPDTLVIVVSDHGFHPEPTAVVPKPLESQLATLPSEPRQIYLRHHRRDAVFCAAGPGVKKDELVIGAQIPDIVPTVLAAFGVPVPSDLNGNVLSSMFDTPPDVSSIDSYEPFAPGDGTHPRDLIEDPWSAHEIVENLSELGFLQLESDSAAALEVCTTHRALNCAEIHAAERRYEESLDLYTDLFERDDSFIVRAPVVQCLIGLKRLDEAESELRELETLLRDPSTASWLWVMLHTAKGDLDAAEKHLEPMLNSRIFNIDVVTQMAWLSLRLKRWETARRLFERILERDPDQARSHDGLGVALLQLGDIDGSIAHHLQSVTLFPHRSLTHERLGYALVAGKQIKRAIRAFETAVQLDPENTRASKMLSHARRLREKEWRKGIDASADPDGGSL